MSQPATRKKPNPCLRRSKRISIANTKTQTETNVYEIMKSACKTLPSPSDERDWNAGNIYKKNNLESILDLRTDLPPVRNQGVQGTCAAQTATCMKEWQEKQDYDFSEYMSPQFIYNNRENQTSEGMFGRDIMRILSKIGSVREDVYKYGKIEPVGDIDADFYNKATNHKIKSYARIYDIDNLKKALSINGPCYIAFPVYNVGVRMWKKEATDPDLPGGHAMTVIGYNNVGFIIRNTWGEEWGDQGYCTYPFSDWGAHWEIWTTIDEKSYLPDIESDEEVKSEDKDTLPDENWHDDPSSDSDTEPKYIQDSLCSRILKFFGVAI